MYRGKVVNVVIEDGKMRGSRIITDSQEVAFYGRDGSRGQAESPEWGKYVDDKKEVSEAQ